MNLVIELITGDCSGMFSPRAKAPVIGPATPRLDGKSESLGEIPPIGEVFNQQLKDVFADYQAFDSITNFPTCARQPEAHISGEVKLRTDVL